MKAESCEQVNDQSWVRNYKTLTNANMDDRAVREDGGGKIVVFKIYILKIYVSLKPFSMILRVYLI